MVPMSLHYVCAVGRFDFFMYERIEIAMCWLSIRYTEAVTQRLDCKQGRQLIGGKLDSGEAGVGFEEAFVD